MAETLTKQQQANIAAKYRPLQEKTYIVTDECFWKENPPKDYNPLDPDRTPHAITLVDVETGTLVRLQSGSLVRVLKVKE